MQPVPDGSPLKNMMRPFGLFKNPTYCFACDTTTTCVAPSEGLQGVSIGELAVAEEALPTKIRDSVAFVTGANRGIGLAFAQELLSAGARKVYAEARHPSCEHRPQRQV